MPTVLLAEDDVVLTCILEEMLEHAGYEVIAARSSMDALAILDTDRQIDLLLLDIYMAPREPNGYALGRMASMKRKGIPIILMTGSDLSSLGDDPISLLGKLFYKPLDYPALLAEIALQLSDVDRPSRRHG